MVYPVEEGECGDFPAEGFLEVLRDVLGPEPLLLREVEDDAGFGSIDCPEHHVWT